MGRAILLAAVALVAVLAGPAAAAPALAAAAAPAPATAEGAAATVTLLDRCVRDGRDSDPACAGARYPPERAEADAERLCRSMPDMSGCSLRRMCAAAGGGGGGNGGGSAPPAASSRGPPSPACEPFALLAALCTEMPTMLGCRAYGALCGAGTRSEPVSAEPVPQCREMPPPPALVPSGEARRLVLEACSEMPMAGCALCAPPGPGVGSADSCPDPLRALAGVCREMGGMRQCRAFDDMCGAVVPAAATGAPAPAGAPARAADGGGGDGAARDPLAELCGRGRDDPPPMTMYFHARLAEVLLWRGWVTRTPAAYAGAVFALLAFGVASVALKTARGRFEAQWIHDSLCSRSPARRAAALAQERADAEAECAAGGGGSRGSGTGTGSGSGRSDGSSDGDQPCDGPKGGGGGGLKGGGAAAAAAVLKDDPENGHGIGNGNGHDSGGAAADSGHPRHRIAAALALASPAGAKPSPGNHRERPAQATHHHRGHGEPRGAARVATCCERHAALGPRTRLQRASHSLAAANCARALLVGAAAVFDYFNMLAVMTMNAGFFAAVVLGYALGTLLLSHLVVPPPARLAPAVPSPAADAGGIGGGGGGGGSDDKQRRRRRRMAWLLGPSTAQRSRLGRPAVAAAGVAAAGAAAAGAAAAAPVPTADAAAAAARCGGGADVECGAPSHPQQQPQQPGDDDRHDAESRSELAWHMAASASREGCC